MPDTETPVEDAKQAEDSTPPVQDSSPENQTPKVDAGEKNEQAEERTDFVPRSDYEKLQEENRKLFGKMKSNRDQLKSRIRDLEKASGRQTEVQEPEKIEASSIDYDPVAAAEKVIERRESIAEQKRQIESFQNSVQDFADKSDRYAEADPDYASLMAQRGNQPYPDSALNEAVIEKGDPSFDHFCSLPENAEAISAFRSATPKVKERMIGRLEDRHEAWVKTRKAEKNSTSAPPPIDTDPPSGGITRDRRYDPSISMSEYMAIDDG